MKKVIKKGKNLDYKIDSLTKTVDSLAVSVAKGFGSVDIRLDKVDTRLDKMEKRIGELDDNIKSTRHDVLNMVDKFVSYHTFDQLASRVNNLEKKIK